MMKATINIFKILIADDHLSVAVGITGIIERYIGYTNIESVRSCSKIMEELKAHEYTHLILDIGLSDGSALEILPNIRNLCPSLKIMFYSAKPEFAYKKVSSKYGIRHYISKGADIEETLKGLQSFFKNEPMPISNSDENPFGKLSTRELEVLPYLIQGKGANEISTILGLAPVTVTLNKKKILEKTETKNVAELIKLAIAYNMLD